MIHSQWVSMAIEFDHYTYHPSRHPQRKDAASILVHLLHLTQDEISDHALRAWTIYPSHSNDIKFFDEKMQVTNID